MATLSFDGGQAVMPSFTFPSITASVISVDPLDPMPSTNLPQFTLGTSPTPNPIVALPPFPLPGGSGSGQPGSAICG